MRDSATKFPDIYDKETVLAMRIWYCKYRTLNPVSAFINLEELVIANFPDETLCALKSMKKLRYLRILHMPKLKDISVLSDLSSIESLSLETSPSWDATGRCIVLESMKPIAELPKLKHLELFGVCEANKSLKFLEGVKTIETSRFSQYPQKEVDRFRSVSGAVDKYNPRSSFDI